MRDKRFKIAKGTPSDILVPILNNGEKMYLDEVVALLNLYCACSEGQKSLLEEMKYSDEALDKIWDIMKELHGVVDDEW